MAFLRLIAFFVGLFFSFFFFVIPWMFFVFLTGRQKEFFRVGVFHFGWFLPLMGVRVRVEGAENLEEQSSCFVLSNHQSFLDIPLVIVHVRMVSFLAKKELFRVPLFGPALRYGMTIPVDRGNRRANEKIPALMKENMNKGCSYCVFPEGTRSKDGKMLPFKSGIFRIIKECPVPVAPVTIVGASKLMPRKKWKFHSGEVVVKIHPLISPDEIEALNVHEFRDKVREVIASGIEESS